MQHQRMPCPSFHAYIEAAAASIAARRPKPYHQPANMGCDDVSSEDKDFHNQTTLRRQNPRGPRMSPHRDVSTRDHRATCTPTEPPTEVRPLTWDLCRSRHNMAVNKTVENRFKDSTCTSARHSADHAVLFTTAEG